MKRGRAPPQAEREAEAAWVRSAGGWGEGRQHTVCW